jgi:D-glycero-D-manno-heptose 1,7-bisphosphate phosphatase|tara:strand:- start:665 stop:1252 length:588 start_codon:yes stop_codon:yes gene_type:complete
MKAVFLDRDGVINELIYHKEQQIFDSPFTVGQFKLLPGVCEAIKKLREMDYKAILVSNQPGMAKGTISVETFNNIRDKMEEELAKEGSILDREYYCFHHPEAKSEVFRVDCKCRKPDPGLIIQAAKDMRIELSRSWMIGDNLSDVQAGKRAGCRTILLGRMKCHLCHTMDEEDARPDAIVKDLRDATQYILKQGG